MTVFSRIGLFLDFPVFGPLHNLVRLIYLFFVPLLLPERDRVAWEARHSAVLNNRFNILFSDLDFDLVVPEDFSDAELRKTLDAYAKRKRIFKFLGEVEVYRKGEHQEKQSLERSHGRLLKFIRNVRKVEWQNNDIRRFGEGYHRTKAQRGLKRTESDLLLEIPQLAFLSAEQKEILSSMPTLFPTRSDFFSQILDASWGEEVGWLLKFVDVPHSDKIPFIPKAFLWARKAVWLHDLLCYRAYLRFSLKVMQPTEERLDNLQKVLQKVDQSVIEDLKQDLHTLSEAVLKAQEAGADLTKALRMNVGVRMNAHLNEAYVPSALEEIAAREQQVLNSVKVIVIDHPLYRKWIQAVAPWCLDKLQESYRPIKVTPTRNAEVEGPCQSATVTFWGPLTKRFGIENLTSLARRWTQISDVGPLKIVLCGRFDEHYSKSSLARLFEQTSSYHCQVQMSQTPEGILWLPYPQLLEEEREWIERASALGHPWILGSEEENLQALLRLLKEK